MKNKLSPIISLVLFSSLFVISEEVSFGQVPVQYYTPTLSSLKTAPKIPESINVGEGCIFDPPNSNILRETNPCPGGIDNVEFELYVQTVVASEMSAAWGTFDTKISGGTGDEGMNALKAQAVASRSFAINYQENNDSLICRIEKCQRFVEANKDSIENNVAAYQPAVDAVIQTKHYVLVDARNPEEGISPAFYAASTNSLDGTGKDPESELCTSFVDGWTGDPGFGDASGEYFYNINGQSGFPCHADDVLTTDGDTVGVFPNRGYPRAGHGAGMSQTGALRWAIGTAWNPPGEDYADTTRTTTGFANSGDIGDTIPGFDLKYLKDWRQILMHYYVYPFSPTHRSNPGPTTRLYQLSVAHTDSSVGTTLNLEAGRWEGIEVKFLNDVSAIIGSSTETLTLAPDTSGRQTFLICEEGADVDIQATLVLDGQDVESTCTGVPGKLANLKLSQGGTVKSTGACLQAGAYANVTIGAGKEVGFEDGGFLSSQEGTFTLNDNAIIGITSTAGAPEVHGGSSFILGTNSKLVFHRDAVIGEQDSAAVIFDGGDIDIYDGHVEFWNPDFDTDDIVIHNGGNASFYGDNILISANFEARIGSTFRAGPDDTSFPSEANMGGDHRLVLEGKDESDEDTVAEEQPEEIVEVSSDSSDDNSITIESYPNPFNPTTTIRYRLESDEFVTLKVYNMLGQEVNTLVSDFQTKGVWESLWDGRDNAGTPVASGTYLYQLTAGDITYSGKMVFLK